MIISTLGYIQHEGKTLFLDRSKRHDDIHFGKYNGLGGKMLPGESPKECIIREVFEESGLVLYDPLLRGVIVFPRFNKNQDWMTFVFTGHKFNGHLKEDCEEGYLKWVRNDAISTVPLWEGDHLFLKWLQNEYFFSAKFIYRDKQLFSHEVDFYHGDTIVTQEK